MSDTKATTDDPRIECEQHHPCLAVSDVRAAVQFYTTKLGFSSGFTEGDPHAWGV